MINNKKVVAIIPARGGSKGIPKKNIIEVRGIPLISYTLSEARNSAYIDCIHVSTDSLEIASIAKEFDCSFHSLRPSSLSDDYSRTIDAVLWELEQLPGYDVLILLQPTQPLRKTSHIDKAIELHIRTGCSVVGVSPVSEHPSLMRTLDSSGKLLKILEMKRFSRRQDFSTVYRINGTVYVNAITDVNADLDFNDNEIPLEVPFPFDIDVDEQSDLVELERRLCILENNDEQQFY